MNTILINPTEIESCWEKNDACFIKTKTGKIWVCEKTISAININTLKYIECNKHQNLIELPLLKRGDFYGK